MSDKTKIRIIRFNDGKQERLYDGKRADMTAEDWQRVAKAVAGCLNEMDKDVNAEREAKKGKS